MLNDIVASVMELDSQTSKSLSISSLTPIQSLGKSYCEINYAADFKGSSKSAVYVKRFDLRGLRELRNKEVVLIFPFSPFLNFHNPSMIFKAREFLNSALDFGIPVKPCSLAQNKNELRGYEELACFLNSFFMIEIPLAKKLLGQDIMDILELG